eukprot:scaffold2124_cov180-Pinguiococcus_pyrenoidosus.AAC.1
MSTYLLYRTSMMTRVASSALPLLWRTSSSTPPQRTQCEFSSLDPSRCLEADPGFSPAAERSPWRGIARHLRHDLLAYTYGAWLPLRTYAVGPPRLCARRPSAGNHWGKATTQQGLGLGFRVRVR